MKDVGDENLTKLLNEKLERVEGHYAGRIKKLHFEVEEAKRGLKEMESYYSSSNPAIVSNLTRKIAENVKGDFHMLWRVMQDCLGKDWFASVFLKRANNSKYRIDYEPLDSIIGDLNRLVIRKNPSDITKLGEDMYPILIGYLIDTFNEQKREIMDQIHRRDDYWYNAIVSDEIVYRHEPKYVKAEDNKQLGHQPYVGNISLNGDEKSKEENKARNETTPESEVIQELRRRISMLLNEIRNVKEERLASVEEAKTHCTQLQALQDYITEFTDALGIPKEGLKISQLITRAKKLDVRLLMQKGLNKVISKGKVDLIYKLDILDTSKGSK